MITKKFSAEVGTAQLMDSVKTGTPYLLELTMVHSEPGGVFPPLRMEMPFASEAEFQQLFEGMTDGRKVSVDVSVTFTVR
jgi:hypothetical protein